MKTHIKSKFIKSVSVLLLFIFTMNSSITAYAVDDSSEADSLSAMGYYTAEMLCTELQGRCDSAENINTYTGKTVTELMNSYGFGYSGYGGYATDYGNVRYRDFYSFYFKDWKIVKIFKNDETGLFAYAAESTVSSRSIIAVGASGNFDSSGVDDKTIENLETAILQILLYSDSYQDKALQLFADAVSEMLGPDWGANDLPLYFENIGGPQMQEICKFYEEYKSQAQGREICATGHSLGAGLSVLLSTRYGIEAVTFDSIPMLDVSYFRDYVEMSKCFTGYDDWKFCDYINEVDILGGAWEKQYKNYTLCEDKTVSVDSDITIETLLPDYRTRFNFLTEQELDQLKDEVDALMDMAETACYAHDMSTILTYDEELGFYTLTDYETYNVGEEKSSWRKNMGSQTMEYAENNKNKDLAGLRSVMKYTLETVLDVTNRTLKGSYLILGTSGSDVLSGEASPENYDVILGGDGNDSIRAYSGNDVLIGNAGKDYLNGGYGNDTYVYHSGDGFDTVCDAGGNDAIKLYGFPQDSEISIDADSDADEIIIPDGNKELMSISKLRSEGENSFTLEVYYENGTVSQYVINGFDSTGSGDNPSSVSLPSWFRLISEYIERIYYWFIGVLGF